MNRFSALLAISLCLATACKDEKGESAKATETQVVEETVAAELSIERLLSLETSLKETSDWSKAEPELIATLGPASKGIDNQRYWGAIEGEDCAYLRVDFEGTRIGMISWPKKYSKDAVEQWKKCSMAAGKPVPDEAPPPFEKKATLAELSTDDIETAAKAAGWSYVGMSGMGMGAFDSHKLVFKKESVEAKLTFVRPNGKDQDAKNSLKITPAAEQAKAYEEDGAAFADGPAMLGIRIGTDKAAAAELLEELKAALLVSKAADEVE